MVAPNFSKFVVFKTPFSSSHIAISGVIVVRSFKTLRNFYIIFSVCEVIQGVSILVVLSNFISVSD